MQQDVEALLNKLDVLTTPTASKFEDHSLSPSPPSDSPIQAQSGTAGTQVSVGITPRRDGTISLQLDALAGGHQAESSKLATQTRHSYSTWALADGAAREIMLVLRDAVDTRRPDVMDAALDCLQKLVSFKLIQGPVHSINHKRDSSTAISGVSSDGTESPTAPLQFAAQPPQAQAVELICRCDDVHEEAVELRLLKSLLTVSTASTLALHGQALLLCIRACYNVFLTSRSEVAQATAKATLIQMITIVFQRLEAGTLAVTVPPLAVSDVLGLPPADDSSMSAFVQQFLYDVASTVDPFGTATEGIQAGLDAAFLHKGQEKGDTIEQVVSRVSHADFQQQNSRQQRRLHTSPTDDLNVLLEKDGLLVLRSLCKLSVQGGGSESGGGSSTGIQVGSATSEATMFRGKTLALELLKLVLENSGPVFREGERFLGAIKEHLCLSLLKNCAVPVASVQGLCASLLLTLMTHFRRSLKAEIGIFYPMIILKPLEPPGARMGKRMASSTALSSSDFSPAQKAVIMRCMQGICGNGQLLVDLFVNYDCDLGGANLFERTIAAIVHEAQGTAGQITGSAQQAQQNDAAALQALRYEALRCLTLTLQTLEAWVKVRVGKPEGVRESSQVTPAQEPLEDSTAQTVSVPTTTTTEQQTVDEADEQLRLAWMERFAAYGIAESGAVGGNDQAASIGIGMLTNSTSNAHHLSKRSEGDILESWKSFKRAFEQGVASFNKKPKRGIDFLQQQNLVGKSPTDVARFLLRTRGLDKTLVGDYLGERDDFNIKVMHAFVDALDFSGLEFDAAIRKFLFGFRLPGEAQKIDRLMEKFADRYVSCNPDAFKTADVAYVLAYSVIMLNTDAHNPMVKNKMSKADFLRNNRGINDGGDLPSEFLESLYDRIVTEEIKLGDEVGEGDVEVNDAAAATALSTNGTKNSGSQMSGKDSGLGGMPGGNNSSNNIASQSTSSYSSSWLVDSMMALIPGRQRAMATEPTDAAIKRTHAYLQERARGTTFFETSSGEAVRPMLDVAWAPGLGALSVIFEGEDDEYFVSQCLDGFLAAINLTSTLGMGMLMSTFVSSLTRFTMVHAPNRMYAKHALALRTLVRVADSQGNALSWEMWSDVLRCISRFDLICQVVSGTLTSDTGLFAAAAVKETPSGVARKDSNNRRASAQGNTDVDMALESHSSIGDAKLQASEGLGGGVLLPPKSLPPASVLDMVDSQEINRVFVNTVKLDSDAIVSFVKVLCDVAREELLPTGPPRVFSLSKIVEIAHWNMERIRLVWNRIWAVLADFFTTVGCHESLAVAMYSVDSLRQLAMKFLERDELANYTFQNDFLRPFVSLVRHSKSSEIRELVIRCVSQMVLARVANIKSGWKSVFMVFTTVAADESPHVVRLAFDTVERIIRDYFGYITETETTTFTDCVNCLVAFTNNPHSLDVSLNAIAFLRFCALELAEGDISLMDDVEKPPNEVGDQGIDENGKTTSDAQQHQVPRRNRSQVTLVVDTQASQAVTAAAAVAAETVVNTFQQKSEQSEKTKSKSKSNANGTKANIVVRFTDKDEHMYFWFPLLAGLSELTFDPRQDIRYGALGVLFDILKVHGSAFTREFWVRIYDSVLLPMFDHVRAEVLDTTTFTDEARRTEADAWLYETCTTTLQHLVDVVARYQDAVPELIPRTLELLGGLIRRSHAPLSAVGVAALTKLTLALGLAAKSVPSGGIPWAQLMEAIVSAAKDTKPQIAELIQYRMEVRGRSDMTLNSVALQRERDEEQEASGEQVQRVPLPQRPPSGWSLGSGAGARRLADIKRRASTQLLLAQSCSEIYAAYSREMPASAAVALLSTLQEIAENAVSIDADVGLRHSLSLAQAADGVGPEKMLSDPPHLKLEVESAQAYLSVLMTISAVGPEDVKVQGDVESRLVAACLHNLERFEQQSLAAGMAVEECLASRNPHDGGSKRAQGNGGVDIGTMDVLVAENQALAPLAVATLKAVLSFPPQIFKSHIRDLFPLLTNLISCELAPPEVQKVLSELFATRIGSMVG